MSRPKRPWFRFYVEALSDSKLLRHTPTQRWLWVAMLGIARQSPIPGYLLVSEREPMMAADVARIAAVPVREVERTIPSFIRYGMLAVDHELGAWQVVNWNERQFESDDVTERTRRHRSKEQDGNVPGTFSGTPPDTETDTYPLEPPGGELVPFAVKPPTAIRDQIRKQA